LQCFILFVMISQLQAQIADPVCNCANKGIVKCNTYGLSRCEIWSDDCNLRYCTDLVEKGPLGLDSGLGGGLAYYKGSLFVANMNYNNVMVAKQIRSSAAGNATLSVFAQSGKDLQPLDVVVSDDVLYILNAKDGQGYKASISYVDLNTCNPKAGTPCVPQDFAGAIDPDKTVSQPGAMTAMGGYLFVTSGAYPGWITRIPICKKPPCTESLRIETAHGPHQAIAADPGGSGIYLGNFGTPSLIARMSDPLSKAPAVSVLVTSVDLASITGMDIDSTGQIFAVASQDHRIVVVNISDPNTSHISSGSTPPSKLVYLDNQYPGTSKYFIYGEQAPAVVIELDPYIH
jgi:hypothetical protein